MNEMLFYKLNNVLKEEGKKALEQKDYLKVQDTINIRKILDNYDELEPTLKKFFDEKAKREKFERDR